MDAAGCSAAARTPSCGVRAGMGRDGAWAGHASRLARPQVEEDRGPAVSPPVGRSIPAAARPCSGPLRDTISIRFRLRVARLAARRAAPGSAKPSAEASPAGIAAIRTSPDGFRLHGVRRWGGRMAGTPPPTTQAIRLAAHARGPGLARHTAMPTHAGLKRRGQSGVIDSGAARAN